MKDSENLDTNDHNSNNQNNNEKENNDDKNYYWQSFLISILLYLGFILILLAFGIYKHERTLGGVPFLPLVYIVNKALKFFSKKYGSDLLE
ncbi:MAG: hypothetical protein ABI543_12020 [Ignavibacteria bacterium]